MNTAIYTLCTIDIYVILLNVFKIDIYIYYICFYIEAYLYIYRFTHKHTYITNPPSLIFNITYKLICFV